MLSTPSLNDFELPIITFDGEGDSQDMVAGLDHFQDTPDTFSLVVEGRPWEIHIFNQFVFNMSGGLVEKHLNHLEEIGILFISRRGIWLSVLGLDKSAGNTGIGFGSRRDEAILPNRPAY